MTNSLTPDNAAEIRDKIKHLKKEIGQNLAEIESLQESCVHEFKKVWGKLDTNEFQFKVIGYRCTICGLFENKKGGERCYVCDGLMKMVGYIPGQGDGYHLQKCKECGRFSDANYYGKYKGSIPSGDFIEE